MIRQKTKLRVFIYTYKCVHMPGRSFFYAGGNCRDNNLNLHMTQNILFSMSMADGNISKLQQGRASQVLKNGKGIQVLEAAVELLVLETLKNRSGSHLSA